MANNLGTLSGTLILQEVIDSLLANFPVVSQIAYEFKNVAAKLNQTVNSRVIVPRTAKTFDPAVGYVADDASAIDVPVTITSHIHHTFEVTDVEQSKTDRKLRNELVATAQHAIGTKLVNDLTGTILGASYPLEYERAAVDFGRDDLTKVRTLLNKNHVPELGRFALVNSDYAEGLLLDSVIAANPNGSNSDVVASGKVPKQISGFATSEYAALPDNNENLMGFAGNREAIIMAARVPDIPADMAEIPGRIQNVVEPNSGFTVQHRRYYDMKLGKLVESLTVMYGFAVGLSEAGLSKRLVRIVAP